MTYTLHLGDCIDVMQTLPECSVQTCVTSPPYYGLRDYGHAGQIGLESTPTEYVERLVAVFREVRRVMRDDGTLWLNLGDSYAVTGGAREYGSADGATGRADAPGGPRRAPAGTKPKDLVGIPWRVAFALQADGWYLRQDIIWHKPNPMPESVRDRCTKAHEYVFLLSKEPRYFYDAEAIAEPAIHAGDVKTNNAGKNGDMGAYGATRGGFLRPGGVTVKETRNRRSVWLIGSQPFDGAHFAVMPEALVEPCILAGSRRGDVVLDPFTGSGTVGAVAERLGRDFVGCELNPEYLRIAEARIARATGVAPITTKTKEGERVTQHSLFTGETP